MYGYIYYCKNKITGKYYIGQTINFTHRKAHHLADLRGNRHHSSKLQNAYNEYGEAAFEWTYEIYELENIRDLYLLEKEKIAEYNSYYDGYNCTPGGESSNSAFDFHTGAIIYRVLQKYEGVARAIGRYYNCNHHIILEIKDNSIYEKEVVSQDEIDNFVSKLNLLDKNLKENYVPHNDRKLSEQDCYDILSIILFEKGYDKLVANLYNIDAKAIGRLKNNLIYKEYIEKFLAMPEEEVKCIRDKVKQKYDFDSLMAQRQRRCVASPLTQEDVNYILDNKDKMKRVDIAKKLNISADRVSSVIRGISYKDLVKNYYNCRG